MAVPPNSKYILHKLHKEVVSAKEERETYSRWIDELDEQIARKKQRFIDIAGENENNLEYTSIQFTQERAPHPEHKFLMVTGPAVS